MILSCSLFHCDCYMICGEWRDWLHWPCLAGPTHFNFNLSRRPLTPLTYNDIITGGPSRSCQSAQVTEDKTNDKQITFLSQQEQNVKKHRRYIMRTSHYCKKTRRGLQLTKFSWMTNWYKIVTLSGTEMTHDTNVRKSCRISIMFSIYQIINIIPLIHYVFISQLLLPFPCLVKNRRK